MLSLSALGVLLASADALQLKMDIHRQNDQSKGFDLGTHLRSHGFVVKHATADPAPWFLERSNDVYFGVGTMGTPPQNVQFPFSFLNETSAICLASAPYNPVLSSSVRTSGDPTSVSYLEEYTLYGTKYFDVFNITGVIIPDQPFMFCGNVFAPSTLGFGPLVSPANNSILRNLDDVAGLSSPLFGMWLGAPFVDNLGGEITFGQTSPGRYMLPLTGHTLYVPQFRLWNVEATNFGFGSTALGYSGMFVLDPQSPTIIMPRHAGQVLAQVFNWTITSSNGYDTYQFPPLWSPPANLTLNFEINHQMYTVPPSVWVNRFTDTSPLVIGADILYKNNPLWILGHPFLIAIYSSYNWATDTISLAQAVRGF